MDSNEKRPPDRKNLYMFNLPKDYEGRLKLVQDMAKKKDVTLLELPEGLLTKGHIVYRCNKHGRVCDTVVKRFLVFENKPKCCGNAAKIVDYSEDLIQKAEELNHTIVELGEGSKGKSLFYCPRHNYYSQPMSNEQYLRNDNGLKCCGDETLRGPRYTENQKKLKSQTYMDYENNLNPKARFKAGEQVAWINAVAATPEYKLYSIGPGPDQPKDEPIKYSTHHLYSFQKYPPLRTEPLNGFVIEDSIHKSFHGTMSKLKREGSGHKFYHDYTCEDLVEYLTSLLKRPYTLVNNEKIYCLFGWLYKEAEIKRAISCLNKRCIQLAPLVKKLNK